MFGKHFLFHETVGCQLRLQWTQIDEVVSVYRSFCDFGFQAPDKVVFKIRVGPHVS